MVTWTWKHWFWRRCRCRRRWHRRCWSRWWYVKGTSSTTIASYL